jgi:hypothetical protein
MAYSGEIEYEQIPYYEVDWSNTVRLVSVKDIEDIPGNMDSIGSIFDIILEGLARVLTTDTFDLTQITFDEERKSKIDKLRFVVLGKARVEELSDEQEYYILLIERI